ncbi:hypothetical protein Q8A67_009353 [Cirrhinus molitorella]|uniref:SSD domain-containing protein n=1 Tax=Cirrhinus molitorella TaxID=172907 RepID=A0AA88PUF4_9TELE|nr:hypothetical protein Q8A67_009353 [Cirrhinus molitorella]
MVSCITDCIEKPIRLCFESVGKFVGLHPWWFVILPLALSTGLGGGLYFLNDLKSNDIVEQFTPKNGRAKVEKRYFQETFPQIDSQFSIIRLNTDGVFASLIFSSQTNILSVAALEEIIRIDGEVRGITAIHDAQQFVFSDICATVNGTCSSNMMLDALNYNASNFHFVSITYPEYCYSELNCIHMGNIIRIGIDDMFIMISSWQRTNIQDPVPKRMADTYREAAVSITITTLTDVLAFYLSYGNPFGSVQSFCLYAGTAILFCYFYNITFFGACLALNGRREGANRHWLTCMKVPEEVPPGRSKVYTLCCVGGSYDHNTGTEEEHPMTLFFRNCSEFNREDRIELTTGDSRELPMSTVGLPSSVYIL